MSRATSPWRRLTPLAARLVRSANWLTPNGSPASSGRVRPSRMTSSASTPMRRRQPGERLGDLVGRVGVVARRDRRVGGEDRALGAIAASPSSSVPPWARAASSETNARVALVEVQEVGLDAQRGERADAAGAEQHVLGEPRVGVADVEPRRDPAREVRVLRPLRVEQVERDAADVDAPDLRDDLHVADRHGDRERLAVGAADERGREVLRVRVDPVLVLPAARVDALAEVALAVHQADGDQRHREVGGLLEDVAGQRAEAARVDRQRAVDAELRAEVGDGARPRRRGGRGRPRPRPARRRCARAARCRPRRARASAGSASWSRRTGFSPQRSQRSGSTARNSSGPPGVQDQR